MIPHSSSTATTQKVSYHHQEICFQQEHPTVTANFTVESVYLEQLQNIILHMWKHLVKIENQLWKCHIR